MNLRRNNNRGRDAAQGGGEGAGASNVPGNVPPPAPGDAQGMNLLAQLMAAQQQQQEVFQRQQREREAQHAAQTERLAQALRQIAEQNGMPRTNRKLTEFFGRPEDDVDDWIHSVNQEAAAGNWPEAHKLNMARAALRGAASHWEPDAAMNVDWAAWSMALVSAFRKKYTLHEWFNLIMGRKQRENESAAQYAIETKKLLLFCPHPMEEREFVKYVIQGIRHKQFSSILLSNPPVTMTQFAAVYGEMEANAAFGLTEEKSQHESLGTLKMQMKQQEDKLATLERAALLKEVEKKNKTSGSRSTPYPRSEERQSFNNPAKSVECRNCYERGHIARDCPRERACYKCGKSGHLIRDCREICHRCGSSDHVLANCQNRGSTRLDNRTQSSENAKTGLKGAGPVPKQ